MKIQLNNIKTYFISPCEGKYLERCDTMKTLGEKMSAMFIHQKSGNNYPQSLNEAHSQILKSNLNDLPILLLEDDVKWNGVLDVEIPTDADALYLGNSNSGNHYLQWPHLKKAGHNHYRIFSMRGAHAIIYISKKYKEFASLSIDGNKQVLDVTLAGIQKNFNVYTLNEPIFYQDNSNAQSTNLNVTNILKCRNVHYTKVVASSFFILLVFFIILFFYVKKK